ncbi:MAG TPA: DUF4250 domain-containing protein [Candidatus Fimiplasma intestinipullorum]|uniref:DUF4250 domain-containing protein n=1 Tax=Candidatus Fimiplasma intestinipullorum TaxID=2840825 RepID=A0A9D1HR55_9FIRM|nr:DUF4250 domain-containing protein [Candidatus Fimiplasma intestinipullorum]
MCSVPKDPFMLVSWLNMKLRDQYDSLDRLCDDLDLDREAILATVASNDYYYDKTNNQMKQK